MEALLNILPIIQITLAVILTGAILLQQRGAGLGGAFGGADGGVHYERRGFERTLFKATIAIAIAFVVSVMISVIYGTQTNVENIDTGTTTPPIDSNIILDPEDFIIETEDGEILKNIEITPIDENNESVIEESVEENNTSETTESE